MASARAEGLLDRVHRWLCLLLQGRGVVQSRRRDDRGWHHVDGHNDTAQRSAGRAGRVQQLGELEAAYVLHAQASGTVHDQPP